MPKSKSHGKSFIESVLLDTFEKDKELKFIDFGVGRGTYSNLLREKFPESSWTGVEVYKPYIDRFNLEGKYDQVINVDMLHIDVALLDFDIAFLGDVLEHCTKNEAIQFLKRIEQRIPLLIVSLPLGYRPQGIVEDNPYEEHKKNNWIHDEALLAFDSCVLSYIEKDTGVYILCYGQPEYMTELMRAALKAQQKNEISGILKVNNRNFLSKKFHFVCGKGLYLLRRVLYSIKKKI